MRNHRSIPSSVRFVHVSLLLIATACGCAPRPSGDELLRPTARESEAISGSETGATLAMVNGRPVTLHHLAPTLLESAGAVALDEFVLDLVLDDEMRRRGVRLTEDDLRNERAHFLETLADAGVVDDNQSAESLLLTVRRARGLGPQRFDRLLHRSAALRALIREEVVVTEEMVQLVHAVEHGEKRRVRLLTTATLDEMQRAVTALEKGMDFAEAAARFSTDSSAPRGGMIEPISSADPTYPESIRSAMRTMAPGATSAPILIDNGFALIRLEEIIPPDGASLASTKAALERMVRRREERRLMAERADQLRRRAQITVLNPHLGFSHDAR